MEKSQREMVVWLRILCIHEDVHCAIAILQSVRDKFKKARILIKPMEQKRRRAKSQTDSAGVMGVY